MQRLIASCWHEAKIKLFNAVPGSWSAATPKTWLSDDLVTVMAPSRNISERNTWAHLWYYSTSCYQHLVATYQMGPLSVPTYNHYSFVMEFLNLNSFSSVPLGCSLERICEPITQFKRSVQLTYNQAEPRRAESPPINQSINQLHKHNLRSGVHTRVGVSHKHLIFIFYYLWLLQ